MTFCTVVQLFGPEEENEFVKSQNFVSPFYFVVIISSLVYFLWEDLHTIVRKLLD